MHIHLNNKIIVGINYLRLSNTPLDSWFLQIKSGNKLSNVAKYTFGSLIPANQKRESTVKSPLFCMIIAYQNNSLNQSILIMIMSLIHTRCLSSVQCSVGIHRVCTQRNIFEILLNQPEIWLYLPFSDWFETKRTSVWFQINR